jgi:hypothetical protein
MGMTSARPIREPPASGVADGAEAGPAPEGNGAVGLTAGAGSGFFLKKLNMEWFAGVALFYETTQAPTRNRVR